MNCALCIVEGRVPNPATTILNGHSVCAEHIKDVVAAPGARGVTISRMRSDSPHLCVCGHHQRIHDDHTCAAGVGGGETCSCTSFSPRVVSASNSLSA